MIDQLERAFDGPAWHGPALCEALAGVTAVQAATRPFSAAHTIWELTLHVSAWTQAVTTRLITDYVALPEDGDWPACGNDWDATQTILRQRHESLLATVKALNPDDLERRLGTTYDAPTASGYTIYQTIHGLIQHHLYHAGQIVLLRKALV